MAVCYFHQATQVEKESGAVGEKEIGDYNYKLSISYDLKKTYVSITTFIETIFFLV